MTSMIISSVILFSCCMLIAQCEDEVKPENLQNFLSVFNGKFDNIEQHKASIRIIDRIQVRIEPVSMIIDEGPIIYLEEARNGKVRLMLAGMVEEFVDGDFKVWLYLIPGVSPHRYRPNQFNPAYLANNTVSNFESYGKCPIKLNHLNSCDHYEGTWTDCRSNILGNQVMYNGTITCDTLTFTSRSQYSVIGKQFFLKRLASNHPHPGPCIDRM